MAIVNWPNTELYGAFVYITHKSGLSATYNPTGQCFPGCGVWGTVDFDSKYKCLRGETRNHGATIQ